MTKNKKTKRTGFTLFAGGDGVGIAMKMLGVVPVGGVEWDDDIAAVARANGFDVTTADILQCNPAQFPIKTGVRISWLHASPPCPNFSVAKAGARETANDLALARKVADFISFHLPDVFTLENVYKYRKSHSMLLIGLTLQQLGYKYIWKHVNFADYGVPQTRRRFILIARRDGVAPTITMPTHQKQPDLFSKKWIGWHESIADLVAGLPTAYHQKGRPCEHDPNARECRQSPHCIGHFADWQMKRLPDEFVDSWMCAVANGTGGADRRGADRRGVEPSATVLSAGGGRVYRAFVKGSVLVSNAGSHPVGHPKRTAQTYVSDSPALPVTAQHDSRLRAFIINDADSKPSTVRGGGVPSATITASGQLASRAFVAAQGGYDGNLPTASGDEPHGTVTANSNQQDIKAFVVNGTPNDYGKSVMVRDGGEPAFTATSTAEKRPQRAITNGRIVKMTPRALLRFQSFPDWYKVPATAAWELATGQSYLSIEDETHTNVNGTLAVKIGGNAVPPVGLAGVMRDVFN